jgi:diguanylate cyclase (GGDEF)-like protein
MRIWLLIFAAVLAIAGSVLYASEAQRSTAKINLSEARTASSMRSEFLDQERGLSAYLATGRTALLRPYFDSGRALAAAFDHAREVSADDPPELATISRQARAWGEWRALARRELRRARSGGRTPAAEVRRRDVLIGRFTSANAAYDRRLGVVREEEEGSAALVPVWIILGLSGLFIAAGAAYMYVTRRRSRAEAKAAAAAQAQEESFARTQGRFVEALQVAEDQPEAHRLLSNHLGGSIPGSSALVLNRNNSANRLEPTQRLPEDHPLCEPLKQAAPRSCLAVRLSRRYERGDTPEVLTCELCGALTADSTCQPLLVGGEVIGSVLVSHDEPLDDRGRRRIDESVNQAAPVLANLRNLAIAEMRAATDALTGLPNKRALDDNLKRLLAQAGRTAIPMSLILLDLDYFKKINDTFGHERGNEALAAVGIFLRGEVRTSDVAARMGGEEFAILLPDTGREGALQLAEKLRRGLHAVKVTGLQQPLTASFGVATYPDDAVDGDVLMRIADRALYAAKQAGRDRVEAPSGMPRVRPEASASDSLPASS